MWVLAHDKAPPPLLSKRENDFIRGHYSIMTNAEIARRLHRTSEGTAPMRTNTAWQTIRRNAPTHSSDEKDDKEGNDDIR